MKVFKFGGASVKDANGIRNLYQVIQKKGGQDAVVVVSAMGKMTNALEAVVEAYFEAPETISTHITQIHAYHFSHIDDLFGAEAKVVKSKVYWTGIF